MSVYRLLAFKKHKFRRLKNCYKCLLNEVWIGETRHIFRLSFAQMRRFAQKHFRTAFCAVKIVNIFWDHQFLYFCTLTGDNDQNTYRHRTFQIFPHSLFSLLTYANYVIFSSSWPYNYRPSYDVMQAWQQKHRTYTDTQARLHSLTCLLRFTRLYSLKIFSGQ
jgi:hypothetical protein